MKAVIITILLLFFIWNTKQEPEVIHPIGSSIVIAGDTVIVYQRHKEIVFYTKKTAMYVTSECEIELINRNRNENRN